jgi:hypothetical protein
MNKHLNNFKKIHSDDKVVVLKHPDGHEIHVAKMHLSPKLRGDIEAMKMDEGGEVYNNIGKNMQQSSKNADIMRAAFRPKSQPAQPIPDEAPKMADGGQVDPLAPPQLTDEQIRAYATQSGMPGASMNPIDQMNTEALRPYAEANVVKSNLEDLQSEKHKQDVANQWKLEDQKFQQSKIDDANKYRLAAGLPPIPDVLQQTAPAPQSNGIVNASMPMEQAAAQPQNQDPYGYGAYMKTAMGGLGEMKQGLQQQYSAESNLAKQQAEAIEKSQAQQQELSNEFQKKHAELSNEMQSAYEDLKAGHIDPQAYWHDMSTPGKISTIIGLIAGGMAGGVMHQENPAMKVMNEQIDRNIMGQKLNMENKHNVFNAMKAKFGNEMDATNAMRLMYATNVDNELKLAAAKTADPAAKARLLQASGNLALQYAPLQQQLAMKQTMLSGNVSPEMKVAYSPLIPDTERPKVFEELNDAKQLAKVRDRVLEGFDKVAKINTVGGRLGSPLQTKKLIDSIKGSIIPNLSKETAGRYTEQDAAAIEKMFDTLGADPKTMSIMRNKLLQLANEKMNFSRLKAYGIDTSNMGQVNDQGQNKFKAYAPVSGTK